MIERNFLAEEFEANRAHLKRVAYRMLGSLAEAEDAVQEAWFRLSRDDRDDVDNLGGWLSTVVARICLDMLRWRKSRREEQLDDATPAPIAARTGTDPEQEAVFADSVGLALMVVLKKLEPSERVAFVLHDMFGLSFNDIAPIVDRNPAAARQLASRARQRVQGRPAVAEADFVRQRKIVDAFLAASRGGDFAALLEVLDPGVVFRADEIAARLGAQAELRGSHAVAETFSGRAAGAQPALVDGELALVVAPRGRLRVVLRLTIADGRITRIEAVSHLGRLRAFDIALLDR